MQHALAAPFRRVWTGYERALHRRPVLANACTSALLWGCGDVLAQRLVERRRAQDVDARRATFTAAFGACFMGPVGHYWYTYLDLFAGRLFASGSPRFVTFKILADTLLFGPVYVLAFWTWGAVFIDGSGWDGLRKKVSRDFVHTFMAESLFWPAVQSFNFTRIPVEHQLLVVNAMTLMDACFLAWARAQDDWLGVAKQAWRDATAPHALPSTAVPATAAPATAAPQPASVHAA